LAAASYISATDHRLLILLISNDSNPFIELLSSRSNRSLIHVATT